MCELRVFDWNSERRRCHWIIQIEFIENLLTIWLNDVKQHTFSIIMILVLVSFSVDIFYSRRESLRLLCTVYYSTQYSHFKSISKMFSLNYYMHAFHFVISSPANGCTQTEWILIHFCHYYVLCKQTKFMNWTHSKQQYYKYFTITILLYGHVNINYWKVFRP